MIRSQQAQLQQLQQQNREQNPQSATAVIDDTTTPSSERSSSFFPPIPPPATSSNRLSISSLSNRRYSRPPSQATSPNLQPQDASRAPESTEAFPTLRESTSRRSSRDESAYYQAEASMLSRENQMLRQRIRELGKSGTHASVATLLLGSPAVGFVWRPRSGVGISFLCRTNPDYLQSDR